MTYSVFTRSSDSLILSIPHVLSPLGKKGFPCHRSTTLELSPSWYPKLVFFTKIPIQAQNTPHQNCVSPKLLPISIDFLYPDFDSCYYHFMPYRMTLIVLGAIEVHYYFYSMLIWENAIMQYNSVLYTAFDRQSFLPVLLENAPRANNFYYNRPNACSIAIILSMSFAFCVVLGYAFLLNAHPHSCWCSFLPGIQLISCFWHAWTGRPYVQSVELMAIMAKLCRE